MAISVVQAQSSADLANTVTLGAGLTLNNWLLVVANDYGHSTLTIPASPTVGGVVPPAYGTIMSGINTGSTAVSYTFWLMPVTAAMAGATAISFNSGTADGHIKGWAMELHSSTGAVLNLDQSLAAVGTAGTPSCGPIVSSVANTLAVFTFPVNGANPSVTTGGWTIVGGQNFSALGYQSVTSSGTSVSVTGTLSAGNEWAIGLLNIRELPAPSNITRGPTSSSASGAQQTTPLTLTVPGGTPTGSVCWLMTTADLGSSGTPTMTVTSTGTTPVFVGTANYLTTGAVSNLYVFVSTINDQGAVISMTPSGNCYLGMSIATYTGASISQPDVFTSTVQSTAATSFTAPSEITGSANNWAVYLASFIGGGSINTYPGTFVVQDSASRTSIADSNGPVGPAGTTIGGQNWGGTASVEWLGFTVGMTPATTTSTLFGQPATPSGSGGGGGATTGSYGLQFSVTSKSILQGLWFYSPAGATVIPDLIGLYDLTTGLIQYQTATWNGAIASGWIFAPFRAPVNLVPGVLYKAAMHVPFASGNWNITAASYWSSGAGGSGITSGILTAPSDAAAGNFQNSYVSGSSIQYPNTSTSAANIWMDVQVTASPTTSYTAFKQVSNALAATNDNGAYTMGMQFQNSFPFYLNAVWFYSPFGSGELPETIGVYNVPAQSLVHSETPVWSGPSGSGWVRAAFMQPPLLNASTNYKAIILKTGGTNNWYAAYTHYWDTTGPGASGLTNGPMTIPNNTNALNGQTGGGGQDVFNAGSALNYPNNAFNAGNYWVDAEVSTLGGYTLWGGGLPAGTSGFIGTGTFSGGLQFSVTSLSSLSGYWWYVPVGGDTVGSHYVGQLFTTTTGNSGTLVTGSQVTGTGTWIAGAWNFLPLSSPIILATSTNYVANVYETASSDIQFLHHYWDTGGGISGMTSGPISAPGASTALSNLQQGFNNAISGAFPASNNQNSFYGLDIQVNVLAGPTLVQVVPAHVSGSNTVTATIAATGAGNTLVALIGDVSSLNNGTPNAVTLGGLADNWTQAAVQGSATDHSVVAGWVDPNCAGGKTTVTVTTTGATGTEDIFLWVYEWANLPGGVDKTSAGANTFAASWTSGATATTTQASEVAFGITAGNTQGGSTGALTGPSSPWINQAFQQNGPKISLPGYNILTSTQAVTYNGTASPNNTNDTLVFTLGLTGGPTAISVSDFAGVVEVFLINTAVPVFENAGMVESRAITATVPVSDFAGLVESVSVSQFIAIFVTDFAGQVESAPHLTNTIPVSDYAGMVEKMTGTVGLSVSDVAAGLDAIFRAGVVGTNLNLPAIVFMAGAYPGDT